MEFDTVADCINGVPHMTREQGLKLYGHLREQQARRILEIGTAHGASASYMAAALIANGGGTIDTVDSVHGAESHQPPAVDTIKRAGVAEAVNRIAVPHSSYNWWLKEQIAANSDVNGNCSPIYDFCYLDGAHNFTIDGLAFFLIDKLLRPGGWLLFDDLDWTYAGSAAVASQAGDLPMSSDELQSAQVMPIFELLVQQHPDYTDFLVEDENWGWARKDPGSTSRTLTVRRSETISSTTVRTVKRVVQKVLRSR